MDRPRRAGRPVGLVLALTVALLGSSPAGSRADDLRIARLEPGSDGLSVVVEGAGRKADRLAVWVDGRRVEAAVAAADGAVRLVLSDVDPGARWLAIGFDGRRAEPAVALALRPTGRSAPVAEGGAPWAEWAIYHVMVGHFRSGLGANDGEIDGWRHPTYAGGDLQGVLESVDYLDDLGFDAVWLSPIFPAATSHGYDVRNYYRVSGAVAVPEDPEASLALFRRVRDALHERGIAVILDLPLNHASRAYDMENGDPSGLRPRSTAARQDTERLWDSWGAGFRYWNLEDEGTRRFLLDVALHWLVEEGVDGLRLDYARGVPPEFWAELRAEVLAARPSAWLVGEVWLDGEGVAANVREMASFYRPVEGKGPPFDSLLDFALQAVATEVFARGGEAVDLESWLQRSAAAWGPAAVPASFLDNHDVSRFLSWSGDSDRLVAALAFLATLSRPLVLFYGTETGLAGGSPAPGFTDSGRVPMPWDSLDGSLTGRVAEVLEARHAHPSLARGARRPLLADENLLVYAKVGAAEVALVGVNLGDEPRRVTLAAAAIPGDAGVWSAVLGGAVPRRPEPGGDLVWELPAGATTVAVAPLPGAE